MYIYKYSFYKNVSIEIHRILRPRESQHVEDSVPISFYFMNKKLVITALSV
jgi:hypothetical protein